MNYLLVFIGSGIGGVLRWVISNHCNTSYPYGTLLVNVLGCFFVALFSRLIPADSQVRLLLVAGFCGGFTTFSTFINENFMMLRGTQFLVTLVYITVSVVLGLCAAWIGYKL